MKLKPTYWRPRISNGAPAADLVEQSARAAESHSEASTEVVDIFPTGGSIVRVVGAVLAEQHDEWQISRRYLIADSLAKLTQALLLRRCRSRESNLFTHLP